ncbi:unnamed protein product [Danaus chrysippus]|uniref:(African queen) hypothetical protein n=1 Tax=Danaus chrysippus TaxID=151541 RepID=A0A8J2VUJ6_9NEOP|nr:unnamed protein product [Danaus chrysippus]
MYNVSNIPGVSLESSSPQHTDSNRQPLETRMRRRSESTFAGSLPRSSTSERDGAIRTKETAVVFSGKP